MLLYSNNKKKPSGYSIYILFSIMFLLRILSAGLSGGFDNDTACFAAWADRIFQVGAREFYSPDVFTDYPPGYMYLLYPIGALRSLLNIEYYSTTHLILLRLPAILCDLGCGILLYNQARKQLQPKAALIFSGLYLLNPAIILNSSIWGQVDSVFTLLLMVLCLSLTKGRLFPAFLSFCLGIFIKPQMLIFAPVLFAGILDYVFLKNFSWKNLLKNVGWGLLSLFTAIMLILPFGLQNVLKQYVSTVGSYPYAGVNVWNFWGLLGLNWVSQDNTFLGLPYRLYGTAAICIAVVLVLVLSLRLRNENKKYPLLAAFLMTTVYLFSVRMHERYLYSAIVLLLLFCIYQPTKQLISCYIGFSLLHFGNTAYVLFGYDPSNYNRLAFPILAGSAGMLAFGIFFYRTIFFKPKPVAKVKAYSFSLPQAPSPSRKPSKLIKADWLCMLAVTLIYSCFALYDLGDRQAPVTPYHMTSQETILLDFGTANPTDIAKLSYYIAPPHNSVFTLTTKIPEIDFWYSHGEITLENVFTWQEISLHPDTSILQFTLLSDSASLMELVFTDHEGNILTPVNAADYPALFDEQTLLPEQLSFRNSMYFDEIYHGRTAYEFLHGLNTYESTHPPMGKIIISLGIVLFGMNPFGWRIMGTLFGIAMLPLIYLFAKKLTDHTPLATLAAVLFAFDFMHFTQTRLATIDVYITFFVLLMYLFMYQYSRLSFYDTPLWKTFIPLGACGISMGFGFACKWTGAYAGMGLAVLFFALLFQRYREYQYALKYPKHSTNGISHKHILQVFQPYTAKTLLFCVLFFVLIPLLIYLVSYLPFSDGTSDGILTRLLRNQEYMLSYHGGLDATHPFSSPWYEWPIIKRPIWYYSGILTGSYGEGGIRESISAFGNPLVWWASIPASIYMIWLIVRKKDRTAAFLLTGYLAQYLPWFFVSRITFIYHYFPSVIFVVLMLIHSLAQLKQQLSKWQLTVLLLFYGTAVFALFLLFYPLLAGQPIDAAFATRFLCWFKSWILLAK